MKRALVGLIRAYQWIVSPMFPPQCRFLPTCSEYAQEAIAVHGTVRGTGLTLWRLLRCHPFSQGGLDPVPEPGHRALSARKRFHGSEMRPDQLAGRERAFTRSKER
jgi:hypothetical protein